jgi:hypothetical protein
MTAEDIDYSAGEPTKPKGSETSAEWGKYRDQMERLTAAVKRAMNMPESEEDSIARDAKKSDEDQSINISLNGSQQYSILIATDSSSAWRLSYANGSAKTRSS